MRLPRVTIAGMMIAVAVIAFDCFLVVNDLIGAWLMGLALSVGLVRMVRNVGRRRRFWAGFEATGLAALLAYIACVEFSAYLVMLWPFILFNGLLVNASPTAAAWLVDLAQSSDTWNLILEITIYEVSYGLPMLVLALVGGLLVARLTWRRDPVPAAAEVVGSV